MYLNIQQKKWQKLNRGVYFILFLAALSFDLRAQMVFTSNPTPNSNNISKSANIELDFDTDIDLLTVHNNSTNANEVYDDNIKIIGNQSGQLEGVYSVGGDNSIILFDPSNDFKAGERITVIVTASVLGSGGEVAIANSFCFTAATGPFEGKFKEKITGIQGMADGSFDWGDYDNDGDLDLVVVGFDPSYNTQAAIYRNDNGSFTDIGAGLTGVFFSSVEWGDYDNDGDLDLVIAGQDDIGNRYTTIYQNNSGIFSDISAGLQGVDYASVDWGDYDNDGDLDLVVIGRYSFGPDLVSSTIYQNNGGVFTDIGAGLLPLNNGSVEWGDYDGDGDLDLVMTGFDDSWSNRYTFIYDNNAGVFTDHAAGLPGVAWGDTDWGDYDNDGDLDLFLLGDGSVLTYTSIYNNTGGVFTDIGAGFPTTSEGSVRWGDYDGDGDLDVVITGNDYSTGTEITNIYNNSGGVFTDINAGLETVYFTGLADWGDFDGDGDLDLMVAGESSTSPTSTLAVLYENSFLSFTTTWVTTDGQITIPTTGGGYNYDIVWTNQTNTGVGDGSITGQTGDYTITGLENGSTYQVEIRGTFPRIYFNNLGDKDKLITIEQWGDISWTSMANAFYGCTNLTVPATDAPDLSGVADLSRMFMNCTSFDEGINHWDVSTIQNMSWMFRGASSFNQDLDGWNVSNVSDMSYMFAYTSAFNGNITTWITTNLGYITSMFWNATAFDRDISGFNVSGVSSFAFVFRGATAFKQNIDGWNVSGGSVFDGMFWDATSFNQNLNSWVVSGASSMSGMFRGATAFSGNISSWNVSGVSGMSFMFYGASNFNSNITGWQVGNVVTMANMFANASMFNQNISSWDVSKVQNMSGMFSGANAFNQNINGWTTGMVSDFSDMFSFNSAFNSPLNSWDVSGATDMSNMFWQATVFNQDISGWVVDGVSDFTNMFSNATDFDQNLGSWDIGSATTMSNMLNNSGLSSTNYDATLIGWEDDNGGGETIPTGITLGATGLIYCSGETARTSLTTTYSWTIIGDSQCSNNALDFDGVNDFVDAGGDASLYGHSNLTIEAWVKPDFSVVNDQYVIVATIGSVGASGGYEMLINSSKQPFLMYRDDTYTDQVLIGNTVLADDTWYHFTGVIENAGASTNLYIYINGVLDASTTFANVPNYDAVSNLFIGSNYDGEPVLNTNTREFSGEIDELRIWDDVRTQAEIQNNISNSLVGNEVNLVAYYSFNEGIPNGDNTTPSVDNLPDLTLSGNNGTLNNFSLNGTTSNWVSSTAFTPFDPSNLFVTEISPTQIDLSWTDNSFGETGFTIERSDGNNTNFVVKGSVGPDVTTYSDNTVVASNGYYYRIIANGSPSDSNPSNEKFGSTIPPPGHALHFDGLDDIVDMGDVDFSSYTALTVEAWVNPAYIPSGPSGETATIIGKGMTSVAGTTTFAIVLEGDGGGPQLFALVDNGSSIAVARYDGGNFDLNTNQWVHVAFTWSDSNPVRLYINGTEVDATSNLSGPLNTVANSLLMGSSTDVNEIEYEGELDEIRIWDTQRTPTEIQDNMFNTLVGNEAGLAMYYRFDQGIAGGDNTTPPIDLLPDRSTNNNNGTLTNFTLNGSTSNWVNSSAQPDLYIVTNTNDSGTGSLRWCLDNAIAAVGKESISFNIPITDPNYDGVNERWTISPSTDLPLVTFASGGVIIDASTQPGTADYRIILDGQGTLTNGLMLQGPSEVYGMWITNFTGGGIYYGGFQNGPAIFGTSGKGNLLNNNNYGIHLFNSSNITIQSNLIGTDPTGLVAAPNNRGIFADGSGVASPYVQGYQIGGSLVSERNIISGNTNEGIFLWYNNGAVIEGNWIGVDATGTTPLPNNQGIVHSIGINATIQGNVISGNTTNGLYLARAENNNIFGNFIGVGNDGSTPLGNDIGIYFEPTGSANLSNTIGGTIAGQENIIANNTTYGVQISNGYGNQVIANGISCNGLQGIDLNGSANNSILPPYIISTTSTSVSGTGVIGENVHVYRDNSGCWPYQGQEYLGTAVVDGSGNWTVTGLTITTASDKITATATNATDGTSEFSPVFINPPGNALDFDGVDDYVDLGDPNEVDFGSGNFTLELWFKPNDLSDGNRILIAKDEGAGGNRQFALQFNPDAYPGQKKLRVLYYKDNTTAVGFDTGDNAINDTNWHHIAAIRNGVIFEVYVDGISIGSGSIFDTPGAMQATSANLVLGTFSNLSSGYVNGQIDEVRIWDDVRTQTELQNNMYNILAGNEANLVAYYRFDQGIPNGDNTTPAVNLLPDMSVNSIDGTLNNFALNGSTSNWVNSTALQPQEPEINVYQGVDNTGAPIADAQVTPIDFGSVLQGADIAQTFTIENTGPVDLNISNITVTGTDYSVTSAITTIVAGTFETFSVTLSGASTGTFNSTITIDNDDTDENPFTFDITGVVMPPEPEINVYLGADNTGIAIVDAQASPIDFGSAIQGTDLVQTFAIENTGTADLTISNISVSGTDFSVASAITTITTGTTETFTITLSGASIGTFTSTITIDNDDSDEDPFTFDITGAITAASEPEINVYAGTDNTGTAITDAQAAPLDVGNAVQGTDITQTFAIENTGTADLTINSISSSGTDYSVNSAITTISTGATETFTVTLSGANTGTFTSSITIDNDDADENSFTFDLTGTITATPEPEINVYTGTDNTGIAIADAQVTPINLGSAVQGTDITQTFAIENTGTAALTVTSILVNGTDFSVASSITTIATGATETFAVTLSGANTGTFTSTVTIDNTDGNENPFTFDVIGSIDGVIIKEDENSGDLVISNQTVDLGSTLVNVNLDKVFVIENPSTSNTLTINSITSDNPVFLIIDPPSSISPASSEQFIIRLLATEAGNYSGNIAVATNLSDFTFIVSGEVFGETFDDIHVFNVITPNSDGVHDFLKIENIANYPDNQVIIYNRWGDKVFEATGYDNQNIVFDGVDNVGSNKELQTGNFYYSIDKGNGDKPLTGFIFLKR